MIQLNCPAANGNLDLCLIACPHKAQLDQMAVPVCDASLEMVEVDDVEFVIVIEEQGKREEESK